jgi:hypothetical protein
MSMGIALEVNFGGTDVDGSDTNAKRQTKNLNVAEMEENIFLHIQNMY